MNSPKKIGPKTRLFLLSRQHKGDERLMIQMVAERFYNVVISMLNPRIEKATKDMEELLEDAKTRVRDIPGEVVEEAKEIVARKIAEIESKPQLRGPQGPAARELTPGVDYVTKEETLAFFARLQASVFTKADTEKLIGQAMADMFSSMNKLSLPKEAIEKIQKAILESLPYEAIARGMEALPAKAKLDYNKGLKNQPSDVSSSPAQRVLHRGTSGQGAQTYYYDLSDLCDGVTKTFTIPTNTRVLDVGCTDAPNGRYRPGVDWTGTGTVTLTLSDDVAAPTEGATLYILYVA